MNIRANNKVNKTVIDGDIAYVMVSKGKYKVIVDADMYHLLDRCIVVKEGYAYDRTECNGKRANMELHRIIMGLSKGDGKQVDHIDRNPLNNRRDNLRLCTPIQNTANKTGSKRSSSRFKGVSKRCGLFHVRLRKNGEMYYEDVFSNEIEAAKAYDKVAVELYGEFAFTNFTGDVCNVPDDIDVIETKYSERRGEKCVRKLTNEQVIEVREMSKTYSQRYIGNHFNVSRELIRYILQGKTYKDV